MRKCFKVPKSELAKKVLRTLLNWKVVSVSVATTFVLGGGNSPF